MNITIQDSVQMHRDFNAVFPRDLVEDLAEEEPQWAQTSEQLDTLLIQKRQEIEKTKNAELEESEQEVKPLKPTFALDTLVTPGWNKILQKGTKNWADFENLITLYALGKLFICQNMPEKAKQDKAELTYVVEEFDRIKRPQVRTHLTAEKRLASTKTYVAFGERTIDASCISDYQSRVEALGYLESEYQEAIEGNEFNGLKLKKAYHIACGVMKNLRQRY